MARSSPRRAARPLDLVLFGATGFTGRQAFLHLLRVAPAGLRWAIGGRDGDKLQALLQQAPEGARLPSIVLADMSDPASVDALVAGTRAVVQLAGPYSPLGESFVAACAARGVHYVDLTGEIFWVRQMIARHHAAAVKSRARLLPVCGFEALPYDIGALLGARALVARHHVRAADIEIVTRLSGPTAWQPSDMLSGGTVASMKAMLAAEPDGSTSDPACLVQDEALAERIRAANPYVLDARWSEREAAWLAPMVPAPFVNVPVICRSVSLLAGRRGAAENPFEPDLHYREALSMRSFAPFPLAQRMAAEGIARTFRQVQAHAENTGALARLQRTASRSFLDWFGPSSGEGPSERALEGAGYEMSITARGRGGEEVHGTGVGVGHPGYRSTAAIAAEVGLLLAIGEASLPARFGMLTPAAGLGEAAVEPLARAGLTYTFE